MDRVIGWIDGLTERVARCAFWLVLLVVAVAAFNTLARYLGKATGTNLSSNAYLELQWYLFGALFLLSGAHALKKGAHVRVDVLYDRLGPRAQAWIDLVGHAALLLPFCAFAVAVSWGPVVDSWRGLEGSPDPDGLPRYPAKTLIPLAFALLVLQGIAELLRKVRAVRELAEPDGGDAPTALPEDEPEPPADPDLAQGDAP